MTKTSITITWPAVPGATKYEVAKNGKPVTSTVPPTAHGLTVANGDTVTITPAVLPALAPVPPPPPPSGLIDDMRAIHMTAMSSVGAVVNPDGSPNGQPDSAIVRSQNPPGFWSSLIYTSPSTADQDLMLIPDARYGKVYRFRTNGQSRNPYWSSPTTCNTELEKDRKLSVGQFDWYGLAVKWEPGWDWSKITWTSVFQFGYPTITSPPLMIGAGNGGDIYVQRYAGLVANAAIADLANGYDYVPIGKYSDYVGKWVEFVVGDRWGGRQDGEVHVSMRCKDNGDTAFRDVWSKTGVNTWQWGGASNVPQDASNFLVCDKLDSYWGYQPGVTDANAPTTYVQHTGHVRAADKATVLACMDAA